MTILLGTHPRYLEHDAGTSHPERPARLEAVLAGVELSQVKDAVIRFEPKPATALSVERVHDENYLVALKRFCLMGGGPIDADTTASIESWDAALLAAGAGLDAIRLLQQGQAQSAFLAVRPPGHHAVRDRAMGFCLLNNVAVSAAQLVSEGSRVLIFDFDAHHGNGTQDIFFGSDQVLYLSTHQHPLYPGTGRVQEVGSNLGFGYTINLPVPQGTNGSTLRLILDRIAEPAVRRFSPDWVIISAGFDGHFKDPLTEMGLTSADFSAFTKWAMQFVPESRTLVFLEGGYDLEALRDSTGAVLSALENENFAPEDSRGDPAFSLVDTLTETRKRALGDRAD